MTKEELIGAFVILECEPGCPLDEVKSSYRQLAKVWHPDRFDGDPKLTIKATEKMKLINEAYQLLTGFFEEHQSCGESARPPAAQAQTAKTDAKASQTQSKEEEDYEIGDENVVITKERDPESGQIVFKKVVETITGYDGRWLSKQAKVFKTKPVSVGDSFELAAKHSMSFSLRPEQGRRGTCWSGTLDGLRGGESHEHETEGGNEWLFPDGSSVATHGGSTDTWFHDDDKKVAHGRSSTSLKDLDEAYRISKKRCDWQVCVEIAQRAVDLHGQNTWGWIQRSYALHCLKQTRAALDALKPAANLFPKKITIFYNLACYASRLGDLPAAKNWLQCVFELAEQQGPYSGMFERYREMALEDSDLASVHNAVPQPPLKWKLRKYFGV